MKRSLRDAGKKRINKTGDNRRHRAARPCFGVLRLLNLEYALKIGGYSWIIHGSYMDSRLKIAQVHRFGQFFDVFLTRPIPSPADPAPWMFAKGFGNQESSACRLGEFRKYIRWRFMGKNTSDSWDEFMDQFYGEFMGYPWDVHGMFMGDGMTMDIIFPNGQET